MAAGPWADMFLPFFLTVIGAVVGSFLNVCIWRIPEGESIVFPASHCPKCGKSIRPWDNIPVLSYLLLRGRCRDCGAPISAQYPAVEVLTALSSLLIYLEFGFSFAGLSAFAFTAALIVVTFIDLEHQIIPDVVTLPGIPLFLVLGVAFMGVSLSDGLIGLIAGGGFLFLIAYGYEKLTGREGMGGGDIKLLAMMGAFLGWQSLYFIVFVASMTGAVAGIAAMVLKKKDTKFAVPFGPFLSFAAFAYLYAGKAVMNYIFWRGTGLE